MIVITQQAETRLLNRLEEIFPDDATLRCYHLSFSALGPIGKGVIPGFLIALQALPGTYRHLVYVCRDGDVFLVTQGLLQHQFVEMMDSLAREWSLERFDITLFDFHRQREELTRLCRMKLTRHKPPAPKPHSLSVAQIIESIDKDLIATLSERRHQRQQPIALVADDDQLARTLAGSVLDKISRLIFAKTGREAVAAYVLYAPDIVFLDIGLPDLRGDRVLEAILFTDPDAYVIMFSSRRNKETVLKTLESGARGFVVKPFTRAALLQYIEQSPFMQEKYGQSRAKAPYLL